MHIIINCWFLIYCSNLTTWLCHRSIFGVLPSVLMLRQIFLRQNQFGFSPKTLGSARFSISANKCGCKCQFGKSNIGHLHPIRTGKSPNRNGPTKCPWDPQMGWRRSVSRQTIGKSLKINHFMHNHHLLNFRLLKYIMPIRKYFLCILNILLNIYGYSFHLQVSTMSRLLLRMSMQLNFLQ